MDVLQQLENVWSRLRDSDRKRLKVRYVKVRQMIARRQQLENAQFIRDFLAALESAEKLSLHRFTDRLHIEYPPKLPITGLLDELRTAIKEHQVVIVCGATGSGKTTQLPKIAIECGCGRSGRIGCTQPRRLAATALAERFAGETRSTIGKEVGYQIRFDDRTSDSTSVKFMTDGILLAETRNDPDLLQYDCLILDEVHERSLNIDFLMGYVKKLVSRRKNIRIIISSATLESGRISEFFDNAPVIEIPGGLFPIEDLYMPPEEDEELNENIARAVEFLGELDHRGDTLVFLPGEREIRECCEYLSGKNYPATDILPLFGRLSAAEQTRVFKHSSRRRIILSTNVAETSVTIPGIHFVIDSGLVRLSRFNPRSGIQELRVERVSQASARQRRGRCGRLSDGVCVRLYSESDLASAPPYTAPEIQRTALSGVILQMAALRLPAIEEFPLLDPPSPALIREGVRTLTDLHAVTAENPGQRQLTREGARLAALPVDPHIGSMLLASKKYNCLSEMLVVASFLSLSDPRERPFDRPKDADAAHKRFDSEESDFLGIIKLYYAAFNQGFSNSKLRAFCKQNYLNFHRMREWKSLALELAEALNGSLPEDAAETVRNSAALHKSILAGIPRHLAEYDKNERLYRDSAGRAFSIFPGSGLAKLKKAHPQLLYFTLMETRARYGRLCAGIDAKVLPEVAPHLCKAFYSDVHYDENSGFVYAKEKISFGSITIVPGRNIHYAKIDPVQSHEVFIRDGICSGKVNRKAAPWLKRLLEDVDLLRSLELKMRRPESIVDENALYRTLCRVLPENMASVNDVKEDFRKNKSNYSFDPADFVYYDDVLEMLDAFPDKITTGKLSARLQYTFAPGEKNDGITAVISEDELSLHNPHLPDYLVPGWLPRKVEFLLKSLPKDVRRELSPLQNAVDGFCDEVKRNAVMTSQSLDDAIIEYLEKNYGVTLPASAFEQAELPEFLVMKVAVTDRDGKVKAVHRGFPDRSRISSRLAGSISAKCGVKNTVADNGVWPCDGVLEDEVVIPNTPGRKGYPALCIEGGKITSAVFLNELDSICNHRDAVVKLIRMRLKDECAYWMKKTRFSNEAKLTLFLNSPNPADALLNAAILASLEVEPQDIRSSSAFDLAVKAATPEIGSNMTKLAAELEEQAKTIDKLNSSIKSLPRQSFCYSDAMRQLQYLYRPGFLEFAEAFAQYPRYLRALGVRLERAAGGGCAKDEMKADNIAPFIERFHLVTDKNDPARNPQLGEFFLLLQESRIAAFSPELRTNIKSAASKLQAAWDSVKLS